MHWILQNATWISGIISVIAILISVASLRR